jgi:hypothetical protein
MSRALTGMPAGERVALSGTQRRWREKIQDRRAETILVLPRALRQELVEH